MKELCKPLIKICGLTNPEEVTWVVEEKADYAGFVLFFPKSKRNLKSEQAAELLEVLREEKKKNKTEKPKAVAVVVSPTAEQIGEIQNLGFDFIQIHGTIGQDVVDCLNIPVIRAVNVQDNDFSQKQQIAEKIRADLRKESELFKGKVAAYLFDAQKPGSGKAFDWEILTMIKQDCGKVILAGGLNPDNVTAAIEAVEPDIVDVSSGVEISKDMVGKDRNKIKEFIRKVRADE